jgi:hypothetical protein
MKMRIRFTWTNWTFGIWWGRFSKSKRQPNHFGLDLGPLELIWDWRQR